MDFYKNIVKRLLIISTAAFSFGCNSSSNNLKLNPAPEEVYTYSIIKTSIQEWTYQDSLHKVYDTVKFNFKLQALKTNEDTIQFKLTFNDLKIIPHPFKVVIKNADIHSNAMSYNPTAIRDSICLYLRGLSVGVELTADGSVTDVTGIDDLVTTISTNSKIDIKEIHWSLADYVSENSIKDLCSRIFSIPRNKEVRVSDSWVKNNIMITKAPIQFSNMYTVTKITGDSAYINIQSIVSTSTTKGGNIYLKGKQDGEAILSYKTGMPYTYETNLESVTTTSQYDLTYKEHLSVKGSVNPKSQ